MEAAAKRLEFEDAAGLRDRIEELRAADLRGAANGRRAASEPATMRPASAKRRLRTLGMTAQAARSDTFGAATPAGRQRGDRGPTAG
ncbi:MAG: hypothetical protein EPN53_12285 [Acidobacteria bacterium]|nr:MAG: hypothetical protein EPN53_12285 [Acidobacteriota bacterium]